MRGLARAPICRRLRDGETHVVEHIAAIADVAGFHGVPLSSPPLSKPRTCPAMPIKALNDRKKLSSDFNEANDAFIDAVLGALQAGEIPLDLARAYLAHPVAMMHASGAQAVADYFERILSQKPTIDWTPGG
jgi:hypothetical protein